MIYFLVIGLFLVAGVLGGYAGYLQGPPDPSQLPPEEQKPLLTRSIVLGIVGAFLVPVFLTLVRATSGSNEDLLDELSSDPKSISGWFVLFGFSLLAAISAQRLISNLTKKLFDDLLEQTNDLSERAEKAERAARENQEDLEDLEEDMVEAEKKRTMPATRSRSAARPLSETSTKVLEAIYRAPERRPSKAQIVQSGQLNESEVNDALDDLENRGLVRSKDYDGTTGWRVRTAGKAIIAQSQLPDEGQPEDVDVPETGGE